MKRSLFIGLALILTGLALAGCIGGGNPSDSHATTRSATNSQTMASDATQTNNRNVCVGIVNLASCNTVQQANLVEEAGDPAQQENPASNGVPLAQSAGVLCGGVPIVLLFGGLTVFGLIFFAGSQK